MGNPSVTSDHPVEPGAAVAAPLRVSRFAGSGEEWDRFVGAQPGWTHFHRFGWKEVTERVFGHECIYLAVRDGAGALAGVLPLVRVRSLLFGHFLVSQPFVNYGGPLGEREAVRRLVDHAVRLAEATGVRLLELRSKTELDLDLPPSHRKVTVLLDLPRQDPQVVWGQLKAKVRSQVRRPLKEGATVRFGLDQAPSFFEVFARNMRDLGTPVHSRRLFETIAEVFPETVRFGCVYLGAQPVAAGCGFQWGDEIEMTWASSLREYNRFAPNMLLYWSFMERAVKEGLAVFNFGRCTPGSGTHAFKLQWGGRDEPLWWYQRAAKEGITTPSPESGANAWAVPLWRHLPLAVANRLGPRIVRYIP